MAAAAAAVAAAAVVPPPGVGEQVDAVTPARGVQNFCSLAVNDTLVDAETLAEGDRWL